MKGLSNKMGSPFFELFGEKRMVRLFWPIAPVELMKATFKPPAHSRTSIGQRTRSQEFFLFS